MSTVIRGNTVFGPNPLLVAGRIDSTFPTNTFNDAVTAIDIQTNEKIIAAGSFSTYSGISRNKIIRLNANGDLDTTFSIGTGFTLAPFTSISKVTVQPNGKIVVTGSILQYSGFNSNGIIRLNDDGSIDNTFNIGVSGFNNGNFALTSSIYHDIQSDGKIVVSGNFTSFSGVPYTGITRLNTGGTLDTSFVVGSGFFGTGNLKNKIQSDGKIVLAGGFTSYSGVARNRIIRLNTDGTIDNSFTIGTGFNTTPQDLDIQPDGKIILVGSFTSYSGVTCNGIIRLNTDGTVDTSFLGGTRFANVPAFGTQTPINVKVLSDGKIIVTGVIVRYNNIISVGVVRLLPNGEYDYNFVSGSGATTTSFFSFFSPIATYTNNDILLGGNITTYNNTNVNRITKIKGTPLI